MWSGSTTTASHPNGRVVSTKSPQHSIPCNSFSSIQYNWRCFFFLQIGHTFRKPSNIFFFFISLLQQIPNVSSSGRYSIILPLIVYIFIDIAKNLLEVLKRLKLDRTENERMVKVWNFELTRWDSCKSKHLIEGNLIMIKNGQSFPADVIPCWLVESGKKFFYISAASTTGANGLEEKACIIPTTKPSQLLNSFFIAVKTHFILHIPACKSQITIEKEQIVNRGYILKNAATPLVCLVVKTGEDCWIRKSLEGYKFYSTKHSIADGNLSKQIISFLILFISVLVIISLAARYFFSFGASYSWTLLIHDTATYFLMYNSAIPIPIYCFLEIIREAQAIFITNDIGFWKGGVHRCAVVNNCSLNADLGSISTIFFDKTGTLTKNCLRYKTIILPDGRKSACLSNIQKMLVIAILTSHSLILSLKPDGTRLAEGTSQEEVCIVTEFLPFLLQYNRNMYIIKIENNFTTTVEILHQMEFTSKARKSSCIVKIDDKPVLVVKGADDAILPKIKKDNLNCFIDSLAVISSQGMKTIVYAMKELEIDDYNKWSSLNSVDTLPLEFEMTLLGSIVMEDELQNGARDTIDFFHSADIRCFMLTGDKRENAVCVGKQVGILENDAMDIEINLSVEQFDSNSVCIPSSCSPKLFNLLISGKFIEHIQQNSVGQKILLDALLSKRCKGAIGYGMSPSNKAFLVKIVQENLEKHTICCAVGDGLNDVGMIRQAQIGIAILGKEGADAANVADYAVGTFSLIKRLIFYHGQLSKQRTDRFLISSFYKSILFCLCHFVHQLIVHFGENELFDQVSYSLFNILWSTYSILSTGNYSLFAN